LDKDQLRALKDYTTKSRDEQDKIREQSSMSTNVLRSYQSCLHLVARGAVSIITAILRTAKLDWKLTSSHHAHALEYLSIILSIRDRKEIIQVMCRSQPDHLTQGVREVFAAYDPVIRHMHNAIDLSGTVGDLQNFLSDMIKIGRIQPSKDGKPAIPTVGDFAQLLRKHQFASHKFIHQCCKNDKELTGWYLEWAKKAASQFRREDRPGSRENGAGDLTAPLNEMFSKLPKDKQDKILPVLDAQTAYLDDMHSASAQRLTSVLKSPPSKNSAIAKVLAGAAGGPNSVPGSRAGSRAGSRDPSPSSIRTTHEENKDLPVPHVSSDPGPGSFLARWQDLLENTPITPLKQQGAVNKASTPAVVNQSATDVDGGQMLQLAAKDARGDKVRPGTKKPDVRIVVDAMAEDFRKLLAERSCDW